MLCLFKKGFFIDEYLFKKVEVQNVVGDYCVIKIWFCWLIVIFEMVGQMIVVYNGQKFIFVYVSENMVGYKFGEFVQICIFCGYIGGKECFGGCCQVVFGGVIDGSYCKV